MKLSQSQQQKIIQALNHHERFKNSYFWTPPQNASSRRQMESRDSFNVSFQHMGHRYKYECLITCSCRHVYYDAGFYLNGEQKNVRLFKNLITIGTQI